MVDQHYSSSIGAKVGDEMKEFLGKQVEVHIDRPIGSKHFINSISKKLSGFDNKKSVFML